MRIHAGCIRPTRLAASRHQWFRMAADLRGGTFDAVFGSLNTVGIEDDENVRYSEDVQSDEGHRDDAKARHSVEVWNDGNLGHELCKHCVIDFNRASLGKVR